MLELVPGPAVATRCCVNGMRNIMTVVLLVFGECLLIQQTLFGLTYYSAMSVSLTSM